MCDCQTCEHELTQPQDICLNCLDNSNWKPKEVDG